MEHRTYGSTGLRVSPVGLGAGQLGDDRLSEDEAAALVNGALDAGVTLIDTARGYGHSEARIGRHAAHRRDEFVLSTKVGYGVEGHEDWTPGCIGAGVERACKLMRTDVLDIVHLHSCPATVLVHSGVVEALLEMKEAGHVRAVAYSGDHLDLAQSLNQRVFDGFMASVNICDQRVIDDALPTVRERNAGFIAKRPVANVPWRHAERPTGKYVEPYWDRFRAMGFGDPTRDEALLEDIAWAEAALRFAAFTPGVASCIVGTANLDHLRENIAAVEKGPLPDGLVQSLRAAFLAHDDEWVGQV